MKNIDKADKDLFWMKEALALAKKSLDSGEVPIGAVIVKNQKLISSAFNMPITTCDPTAHAEILALRKAGQLTKNYRLPDTTLYTTIEPCTMCRGNDPCTNIKTSFWCNRAESWCCSQLFKDT